MKKTLLSALVIASFSVPAFANFSRLANHFNVNMNSPAAKAATKATEEAARRANDEARKAATAKKIAFGKAAGLK